MSTSLNEPIDAVLGDLANPSSADPQINDTLSLSKPPKLRRVLVVDDEPNVTAGIRWNLRRSFDIVTAHGGAEALEKFDKEGQFPVVVSDFRMPGMDGIEFLALIRAKYPDTARIMLSGHVDMASAVRAVNSAGVQQILLKPTDAKTLEQAIAAGLAAYDERATERALAFVDPLLQIGSRRAFDQAAQRIQSQSERYGRVFTLVMADVDNFKKYNDTYGHRAGDSVLQSVAAAMSAAKRLSDELFRFGGEELVLLLPETETAGAMIAIERYRSKVAELKILHTHNTAGIVTISLGAAVSRPGERVEFPLLLEQADRALYRSKAAGRNCTTVWDASFER